jgi:hypothetical protein
MTEIERARAIVNRCTDGEYLCDETGEELVRQIAYDLGIVAEQARQQSAAPAPGPGETPTSELLEAARYLVMSAVTDSGHCPLCQSDLTNESQAHVEHEPYCAVAIAAKAIRKAEAADRPSPPSGSGETPQWQPIETAPKDRVILLYGVHFHRRIWGRGYWFQGVPGDGEGWIAHSFYTEPSDDMRGCFEPTHWMPLPAPPSATLAASPVAQKEDK